MLSYQHQVLAPYYGDKLRLFMLKNYKYNDIEEDGYLRRMDGFVDALSDQSLWDHYNYVRNRKMPIIGEKRKRGDTVARDLLIPDKFGQNSAINEIYRKNQITTNYLKLIYHPNTKYLSSISRGIERNILDGFLKLDDEFRNRRTIIPIINI